MTEPRRAQQGRQVKDITGQKYGRLTVLRFSHVDRRTRLAMWHCRCDCGSVSVVAGKSLRAGEVRSCGCLRIDRLKEVATTHGLSGGRAGTPRLYSIWRNMRHRCRNEKATKYELYGGRGVRVCEEWNDYIAFHAWAIANGYRDDLTLDRVDSDGHYEPANCRWVTPFEQGRFTRNRRLITFRGETRSVTEWAERLGMRATVLSSRINDYGWPIERALTTPVRERRK